MYIVHVHSIRRWCYDTYIYTSIKLLGSLFTWVEGRMQSYGRRRGLMYSLVLHLNSFIHVCLPGGPHWLCYWRPLLLPWQSPEGRSGGPLHLHSQTPNSQHQRPILLPDHHPTEPSWAQLWWVPYMYHRSSALQNPVSVGGSGHITLSLWMCGNLCLLHTYAQHTNRYLHIVCVICT